MTGARATDRERSGTGPGPLKSARDELVARVLSGELRPSELPARYSALADAWLGQVFERATGGRPTGYALLAVGGYGRRALCPGSDLDLVLLRRARRGWARVAEALWYAVWDEGMSLDHSVRTRGEALSVARGDLKAVLGLLDARLVAGDARLAGAVVAGARELWRRQRTTFLPELESACAARHRDAGELAFLLEPDLKHSEGGLRDLAALRALRAALPDAAEAPPEGVEELVTSARVALHCRTGRKSDRLVLQEQDRVAEMLGFSCADALMAALADAGRSVASAARESWRRARSARFSPGVPPGAREEVALGEGIVLRDGEAGLAVDADPASDPSLLVRLALAAAERGVLVERASLDRLELEAATPEEPWPEAFRNAFLALLATGDAVVGVVEALDQRRLFERLLPEWAAVRSRPQRNAYHRYTVDRHLLETVARAAEHAGEVERTDLLLMGALLHDLGKGFGGDHSEAGGELAETIARRIGYDEQDVATLVRIVTYHLVLPEVATRRDLDDPATTRLVARIVEDRRTLELLRALTEADSRATGPLAWSQWKSDLVAKLVERVRRLLDGEPLERPEPCSPTPLEAELLAQGRLAVRATGRRVTVVAPDRPGLLAAAAGALALNRCNVRRATASSAGGGMAVETFDVEPQFDRLPEWPAVEADLEAALLGDLDVAKRLAELESAYAPSRRAVAALRPERHVMIDSETSDLASIVEVRGPDRFGLLHELAATLAAEGCDIQAAFVDTVGHGAIDAFYVLGPNGRKLEDPETVDRVRRALDLVVEASGADGSVGTGSEGARAGDPSGEEARWAARRRDG